tara:strand:- start:264 stop:416 length:153 start_codon:yes stop_codon:yes gene_type:complete
MRKETNITIKINKYILLDFILIKYYENIKNINIIIKIIKKLLKLINTYTI